MSKPIQVSASILCADFNRLGDEIKKCEDAGVDIIHIDVMDGRFVPVISIGRPIVEAVRSITKLPIDTHLMIENPSSQIDNFMDAGADIISIHAECYGLRRETCQQWDQYPKEIDQVDTHRALADIQKIKNRGKKAYFVLNPGTPVQAIDSVLNELDGVLIMSVNPGYAKQKFIADVLTKAQYLSTKFKGDIAIDGGVNDQTAPSAVKAGINVLATASYFFGAPHPKEAVNFLKNLHLKNIS